jgi:hypothetical protein
MNWKNELVSILRSYFSDESIADGIDNLIAVGSASPQEHHRHIHALTAAIKAADGGDPAIFELVSEGNFYEVDDTESALRMLKRILTLYEKGIAADRARGQYKGAQ